MPPLIGALLTLASLLHISDARAPRTRGQQLLLRAADSAASAAGLLPVALPATSPCAVYRKGERKERVSTECVKYNKAGSCHVRARGGGGFSLLCRPPDALLLGGACRQPPATPCPPLPNPSAPQEIEACELHITRTYLESIHDVGRAISRAAVAYTINVAAAGVSALTTVDLAKIGITPENAVAAQESLRKIADTPLTWLETADMPEPAQIWVAATLVEMTADKTKEATTATATGDVQ